MALPNIQTILVLLALSLPYSRAFSWIRSAESNKLPEISQRDVPVPNAFAVALDELQGLESEPFCHRVAARLLVNNCQLIDGKDEATILTDSGRQVRDFVDSYAASLAICDLERGSFIIPQECAKFRENSLSQIAIRSHPQLHVSEKEISFCLAALAASDAAWSTWVSYRHKALRFCEAARGDNEKAQSILLYQKLTRVIAKLSEGVELELQKRMDDLDNRARQALDNIEQISPHLDKLKAGLSRVEKYLSGDLEAKLEKSSKSLHEGLENAENIQQLLKVMFAKVLEGNSELASAHDVSIRQATARANDEMGALASIVASAAASSAVLQQQMRLFSEQATSLGQRQDALEEGFDRLLVTTQKLATDSEYHSQTLQVAANLTNDLLDTLEVTTATAGSLSKSLGGVTNAKWWDFIICPSLTLVLGSYGLEPSIYRNLALISFGEIIAVFLTVPTESFVLLNDIHFFGRPSSEDTEEHEPLNLR